MQRSELKSTMPSGRLCRAVTGQMVTHGAHSQWLQRITVNSRRLLGKAPFSMYLTQVRSTPTGTWCSLLHATVQAWQPMHLRLSMTNPKVGMVFPRKRATEGHGRNTEKDKNAKGRVSAGRSPFSFVFFRVSSVSFRGRFC